MPIQRYLLDTSVFVRFFVEDDPLNVTIAREIERIRESGSAAIFTPQVAREAWTVFTRPRNVGGFGLSTVQAWELISDASVGLRFLEDVPAIYETWLDLVTRHSVSGRQAHDAYHVAAMIVHGIDCVVTLDRRDFDRYESIDVLIPTES